MTDTDVDLASPRASRRTLLGLGAIAAMGAVAGELVVAPAASALPVVPIIEKATKKGKQYKTYSDAAKKAGTSKLFRTKNAQAHLLRRATFGARPSDVKELKRLGIDDWIDKQLSPSSHKDTQGEKAWKMFPLAGASAKRIIKIEKGWEAMFQTSAACLARQVFSNRQVFEIAADIFANHLHVPVPGEQSLTSPDYLKNVIRKNALGSFEKMLLDAMRHPAMLTFLNNDQSRKANVNENLGRELLELHTVGTAAGYSEKMVRSSAAILSGRMWDWKTGKYVYDPKEHVTGRVKVLGFTHANKSGKGGEAVGDAYLRYLANHPSTAKAIARKIAIRFVSDTPSDDLIKRLAKVYLKNDTSIKATIRAVFLSSDFWSSVGVRMRRPLEDAVGALRVLDVKRTKKSADPIGSVYWNLEEAGHSPHGWVPPNGYPDVAAAWLGAGSMIQRWNLHRAAVYGWWRGMTYTKPSMLVKRTKKMTAMAWTRAVAKRLLGVEPSKKHLKAVLHGARLKPGNDAPTSDWECGKVASLLLDSPYFQLR